MQAFLATSQASLICGALAMATLLILRRHRGEDGRTSPQKIVSAFLFGISVYTLIVLVIGHFFLHNMLEMISGGFGEPRVAWLLLGLAADGFARLYRLYDP
jgi:hypothetical protein